MIDLAGLNDQQKQAVLFGKGPCLVLAAAGSGKTRVITMRTARLISEGVPPERILLATFTRRAAGEMRTRLEKMVGEEVAQGIWIGTFHSHCLRILKISYHELGKPTFEVLDPGRAMRLGRDILAAPDEHHPYGMNWQMDPKAALSAISRAKADLTDVPGADKWYIEREVTDPGRYAEFWRRYEQAKREWSTDKPGSLEWMVKKPKSGARPPRRVGLLDFDDLLLLTYQLFDNPAMLSRWQGIWDYIEEDEVQDTMIAQHGIVQKLAARHRNYLAVGDVAQSIFAFRGSSPERTVLGFHQDYPEGTIIKLPTNYRSQSEIVDVGKSLIRHNCIPAAYSLEPSAHREPGEPPALLVSTDEDDEAEQSAQWVLELREQGREPRDFAILYRTNAQSRAFEDAMMRHEIPYIVFGSCPFYDRLEIKDLLAFLQLAHDPSAEPANEALRRVMNIPTKWFGNTTHFLGKAFADGLEALADRAGCSMWQALDRGTWKPWQHRGIDDLRDFVREVKRAAPDPAAMIAKAREVGYDRYLTRTQGASEDDDDGSRFENLDELAYVARNYENAAAFLGYVTQQRSQARTMGNQDAVSLLTMHRAKGCEWPAVFVAGVCMGLLPHWRSVRYYDPETRVHIIPESIEEERRLAYVGVTRAMDVLVVSALMEWHGRRKGVSPFVSELGFEVPDELLEAKEEEEPAEAEQVRLEL